MAQADRTVLADPTAKADPVPKAAVVRLAPNRNSHSRAKINNDKAGSAERSAGLLFIRILATSA